MAAIEFNNGCRAFAEFTQAVEGLPSFMVQGDRGTLVSNGETIELLETDPDQTLAPNRTRYPIEENASGMTAIYADIAADLQKAHLSPPPWKTPCMEQSYSTLLESRTKPALRSPYHRSDD